MLYLLWYKPFMGGTFALNVLNEYKRPIAAICIVLAIFLLCSLISVAGSSKKEDTKNNSTTLSSSTNAPDVTTPGSEDPNSPSTPEVPPKGITVCIDAGHGWKDKGTNSTITDNDGKPYYESDVTLEISKKLRDALEEMGYTVVMIREDDSMTSPAGMKDDICNIERRVDWVNSQTDIDLMISIHCDSFSSSDVNGARIYYNSEYHSEMDLLANGIASSLLDKGASSRFPIIYNDSDRLYSLKYANPSSILVECGFMTSDIDIANLIDPEYEQLFASCLAGAIDAYYSDAEQE